MIRKAMATDFPAVYRLICELEETTFPEEIFFWGYEAVTADPNHTVFVAVIADQVVGVLHLRMEFQLHHCRKIAEIMELVVDINCRSMGIGKQLLTAAEAEAREHHCQQIEVTSNQKRVLAHQFYQREGMEKTHCKLTKTFK